MKQKILVVYYSDSGHTKKVAEYIARATGASVEVVETKAFGRGIWEYLKRSWFSLRKKMIPIKPAAYNPEKFDMLVVGAPVWAGHVACPIRSYLAEQFGHIPKTAFFVTMGGSGGDGALHDMRDISGLEPLAELEISEKDQRTAKDVSKIDDFISHFGDLSSSIH